MSSSKPLHTPVLQDELIDLLDGERLSVVYDGTLGLGGHAHALLTAHPEIKRYIGCDKDRMALEAARKRLAQWEEKLSLFHDSFANSDRHLSLGDEESLSCFFLTSVSRRCSSTRVRGGLVSPKRGRLTCA